MDKSSVFLSFSLCLVLVIANAEESIERNLPISYNQTKILAQSVCSKVFRDQHMAFMCHTNFFSHVRNVTKPPPVLSIKCQTEKMVTFMISPSKSWQLVLLLPPTHYHSMHINHVLVDAGSRYGKIYATPPRNYTFWTTAINKDGSPTLWRKGPDVGVWKAPDPMKYSIKTKMLTSKYVEGTQTIQAEFIWDALDETDFCFYVFNHCNKQTPGTYFDQTIRPDSNQSVVISDLPLGDDCLFKISGKYGETEFEYETPECFKIKKCIPVMEEIKNVTLEIKESPSGPGWNVHLNWLKPRVPVTHYNVTLHADTEYNLILPGSATEVTFENITDEGIHYVTLAAVSERGTAHSSHRFFLPSLEGHAMTVGLLVGAAWFTALTFILVSSLLVYCKRSRMPKKKFDYLQDLQEKPYNEEVEIPKKKLATEDRWEVPGSRLTLHEVVGEGAFGMVRRATLAPGKQVAVKMLKEFPTVEEVRSFRAEMELMKSVGGHPHVVSLVGCCSGRRPLIIAEYCSLGDLLTFLRCSWDVMLTKRSAKYNIDKDSLEYRSDLLKDIGEVNGAVANKLYDLQGACDELTFADLLSFCRQIAMGMEFLASNRVVHRDLAARNVLVTSDKTLKIADFGLSRDVYQENQYKQTTNGKMPVKWMALESLTHRIFTTQSDVWSFGVVMWEVITVGGAPYPAVSAARLPRMLRVGYRMPRPPNCTSELYEVMTSCWRATPCERPTFAQLHAQLDALLAAACADSYLTLDLPVDLPSRKSLPQLTHSLLKSKDPWEPVDNFKKSTLTLSNHYTSTPNTSS